MASPRPPAAAAATATAPTAPQQTPAALPTPASPTPAAATPIPQATPANGQQNQPSATSITSPTQAPSRPDVPITQTSVNPTPQTVPADPSTFKGPSSLDTGGGPDSGNSRSLPIVVIVILVIICAIIGSFIGYRIYRLVFGRLQRRLAQRYNPSSKDLPLPPPPPPQATWLESSNRPFSTIRNPSNNISNSASGSTRLSVQKYPNQYSLPYDVERNDSPSSSKLPFRSYGSNLHSNRTSFEQLSTPMLAIPGSSSGLIPKYNPQREKSERGSKTSEQGLGERSYDNSGPTSSGSNNEMNNNPMRASKKLLLNDDDRPLLLPSSSSASRTSSPSRYSTLNPLLATTDHSKLSTDTLKNAMSRQSVYGAQKNNNNRFSTYENSSPSMSTSNSSNSISPQSTGVSGGQNRRSYRLSSGLPHHKSRIGLTLPQPLSNQSNLNIPEVPNQSESYRRYTQSESTHEA